MFTDEKETLELVDVDLGDDDDIPTLEEVDDMIPEVEVSEVDEETSDETVEVEVTEEEVSLEGDEEEEASEEEELIDPDDDRDAQFKEKLEEVQALAEQLKLTVRVTPKGVEDNPFREGTKVGMIFDVLSDADGEGLTVEELSEKLTGMGVYTINDAATQTKISMFLPVIEEKMAAKLGFPWKLRRAFVPGSRRLRYSMPQDN